MTSQLPQDLWMVDGVILDLLALVPALRPVLGGPISIHSLSPTTLTTIPTKTRSSES